MVESQPKVSIIENIRSVRAFWLILYALVTVGVGMGGYWMGTSQKETSVDTVAVANDVCVNRFLGMAMGTNYKPDTDYVVDRAAYKSYSPRRGDVIIYIDPAQSPFTITKRIIGLPGEQITIKNGQTLINGKALEEPYLSTEERTITSPKGFITEGQTLTIAVDTYFVMGDGRRSSDDSRMRGFLAKEKILGKVISQFQKCPAQAEGTSFD